VAKLKSQDINVTVLCAGTGSAFQDAIRAKPQTLGIADAVRFLGFTDPRTVLWASDILVLPSRREGFALVVAEAMLCSVIPIRTPAAGVTDQIEHGQNGFVIPFDDGQALADRLKEIFANGELRTNMVAAAIDTGQRKFTAERMTNDTIAVYEEVLDRGKPRLPNTTDWLSQSS
jgi:glycosyltransferase involved in cell wall biosynthesis